MWTNILTEQFIHTNRVVFLKEISILIHVEISKERKEVQIQRTQFQWQSILISRSVGKFQFNFTCFFFTATEIAWFSLKFELIPTWNDIENGLVNGHSSKIHFTRCTALYWNRTKWKGKAKRKKKKNVWSTADRMVEIERYRTCDTNARSFIHTHTHTHIFVLSISSPITLHPIQSITDLLR